MRDKDPEQKEKENKEKSAFMNLLKAGAYFGIAIYCIFQIISLITYAKKMEEQKNTPVEETTEVEQVEEKPQVHIDRIRLDADFEVVTVGGVAYLVYDTGYGNSARCYMTPLVDETGTPVTEEKFPEFLNITIK